MYQLNLSEVSLVGGGGEVSTQPNYNGTGGAYGTGYNSNPTQAGTNTSFSSSPVSVLGGGGPINFGNINRTCP